MKNYYFSFYVVKFNLKTCTGSGQPHMWRNTNQREPQFPQCGHPEKVESY